MPRAKKALPEGEKRKRRIIAYGTGTCPHCAKEFTKYRADQKFCTPVHRAAFGNERVKAGLANMNALPSSLVNDGVVKAQTEQLAEIQRAAKIIRERSAAGMSSQDLAPLLSNLLDTIEGK